MVLDPIPQSLPVHFFGSRPQPPTSRAAPSSPEIEGPAKGSFCDRQGISKGWRRLIGSPKLQIIFHKRATKYRSLLRKMTWKDKGSHVSLGHGRFCSHGSMDLTLERSHDTGWRRLRDGVHMCESMDNHPKYV